MFDGHAVFLVGLHAITTSVAEHDRSFRRSSVLGWQLQIAKFNLKR
jgi:hypothetical protein